MLQSWIELARRRHVDRHKARHYLATVADANFRSAMAEYDAFVPTMAAVRPPSFRVGTANDSAGQPVSIQLSLAELTSHWLVQGGTGTGKTTFVTSLIAERFRLGLPCGVFDCKAGFFDAAVEWLGAIAYRLPPVARAELVRRLAVVNPFAETLVPLNVCRPPSRVSPEVQAYDVTLALARLFDLGLSFHMENILRHLLLLLMSANLTLAEAPLVLDDEVLRSILVERCGNTILKDFFFRTYASLPQSSKTALLVRLQALLLPENLRLMLGADEMVDFIGIIQRGDPLLVFLGKGIGVPEEQVDLIGSLVLQLLLQAAYATSGRDHRPYLVVLDEFFHLLAAPNLADRFCTGLTTLRSFGVQLGLVMHNFSQVVPALRETMLANCDLMALFRTSARNAEFFGDFLPDRDPEFEGSQASAVSRTEIRRLLSERLQRLPNRECFWYDRRQPYRALRVRVPDVPEPHDAVGITRSELDRFIDEQRLNIGGVALPKTVLRQQLAARQARIRALLHPPVRLHTPDPPPPSSSGRTPRAVVRTKRPSLGK